MNIHIYCFEILFHFVQKWGTMHVPIAFGLLEYERAGDVTKNAVVGIFFWGGKGIGGTITPQVAVQTCMQNTFIGNIN